MHPDDAQAGGNTLKLGWQLLGHFGHIEPKLPTPTTVDAKPVDVANQVATRNSLQLQSITAILGMPVDTWEKTDLSGNKQRQNGEGQRRRDLLPTPLTTEYKQNDSPAQWERHSPPLATIVHSSEWGKFAPAIQRWEKVIGRQAPAPTVADGKKGQHRLNPVFVEFLMGLPEGHVTACDITRNEMLKALGNGVVPQQAALALAILLEGVEIV